MNSAQESRFWDRSSRKYARSKISDEAGYERTLERPRDLLGPDDKLLELGCGAAPTAPGWRRDRPLLLHHCP